MKKDEAYVELEAMKMIMPLKADPRPTSTRRVKSGPVRSGYLTAVRFAGAVRHHRPVGLWVDGLKRGRAGNDCTTLSCL